MLNLSVDREEFAAERTDRQERAIDRLHPMVEASLTSGRWQPVTRMAVRLFTDAARDIDSDIQVSTNDPLVEDMLTYLMAALSKTGHTDEGTDKRRVQADAITQWVSTMAINAGTEAAAARNRDSVVVEWVTMHDDDVRTTHRHTDGQHRQVGKPFDVDGFELNYPGQPVGPPALWIRCRCVLRVAAPAVTAAASTERQEDDMAETENLPAPVDPARLEPMRWNGVLAIEGGMSGDYRTLIENEVTWRDLPIPLRWVKHDTGSHDGAVIVGRIDNVWRDGSLLRGEGILDDTEEAQEVLRQIAEKFLRGVSVDLDKLEVYADNDDDTPQRDVVGRITAATIVQVPAFQEAHIALGPFEGSSQTADDGAGESFATCVRCGVSYGYDETAGNAGVEVLATGREDELVLELDRKFGSSRVRRVHGQEGRRLEDSSRSSSIMGNDLWANNRGDDTSRMSQQGVRESGSSSTDEPGGEHPAGSTQLSPRSSFTEQLPGVSQGITPQSGASLRQEEGGSEEDRAGGTGPSNLSMGGDGTEGVSEGALRYRGQRVVVYGLQREAACPVCEMSKGNAKSMAIDEGPWNGDASNYTLEQWCKATLIDLEEGCESKNDHKLPVYTPSGDLSRAGVHAAAARINQTEAPAEKIAAAKKKLRAAYKELDEDPPEVIQASASDDGRFVEIPADVGVPGERGLGWVTNTEDTSRLRSTGSLYAWNAQSKDATARTRQEDTAACTTCGGSGTVTFTQQPESQVWTTTSPGQTVTSAGNGTAPSTATDTDESQLTGLGTWRIGWFTNAESARSLMGSNSTIYAETSPASTLRTLNRLRSKRTGTGVSGVTALCANCAVTGYTTSPTQQTGTSTPMALEPASNVSATTTGAQKAVAEIQEFVPADVGIPGERGSGWITNPDDTIRLHRYWTDPGQPGYAKIGWGTPNDFYRCRRELAKYVNPAYLNRTCAEWHHDALGVWPGQHSIGVPSDGAMVAAATFAEDLPPAEWFENPQLSAATPLTVTDEGRVYGHIAEWGTCHIGIKGDCVSAPSSANGYAYFHTGIIRTDSGEATVGTISMGGGHAGLSEGYSATVSHYDSTSTAAAYVHVGEDAHGIWMAGMVSPTLGSEEVFTLRAAGSVSGDWRSIGGGDPDLVAVLAVNVPGFAMPRTAIAASGSSVNAMVAVNPVKPSEADRDLRGLARREARAHLAMKKMRADRARRQFKRGEK